MIIQPSPSAPEPNVKPTMASAIMNQRIERPPMTQGKPHG